MCTAGQPVSPRGQAVSRAGPRSAQPVSLCHPELHTPPALSSCASSDFSRPLPGTNAVSASRGLSTSCQDGARSWLGLKGPRPSLGGSVETQYQVRKTWGWESGEKVRRKCIGWTARQAGGPRGPAGDRHRERRRPFSAALC